eukprot:1161667-Pelagomonas_calceolata.AAC.9
MHCPWSYDRPIWAASLSDHGPMPSPELQKLSHTHTHAHTDMQTCSFTCAPTSGRRRHVGLLRRRAIMWPSVALRAGTFGSDWCTCRGSRRWLSEVPEHSGHEIQGSAAACKLLLGRRRLKQSITVLGTSQNIHMSLQDAEEQITTVWGIGAEDAEEIITVLGIEAGGVEDQITTAWGMDQQNAGASSCG